MTENTIYYDVTYSVILSTVPGFESHGWAGISYSKAYRKYLFIEGFVNPVKNTIENNESIATILKALFPVSRVGSLKWYYII